MDLLTRLGMTVPIVQAPMAGVSTPALAAAVSEAGGLGSIAIGAASVPDAGAMIGAVRERTARAFNVNVFVHAAPRRDPVREAAWIATLTPAFNRFDATPPVALRAVYSSFADDDAMLALLLAAPPPVVSFHFGLPAADRIAALRRAGCVLLATATSADEAGAIEAAGLDGIVAQGWEAGGHRGVFDPDAVDDRLGTMALTRLLATHGRLPVIAAGGIMDGQGIHAALASGACAAQLGTAFVACPDSAADHGYRAALSGAGAAHTVMTRAISGRPARCLPNRLALHDATGVPDYPVAYDAGKALHAAASAHGNHDHGAHWAGQGAPRARCPRAI